MNELDRLLQIMASLRDPESGCPWDVAQDFSTIAPYTIEEAYEVADAIERGDLPGLKNELGDLLLQVVFHSQMANEQGLFAFGDVAQAISDKLVRRHPHVFAGQPAGTEEQQRAAWEAHKSAERQAAGDTSAGALAGVTPNLPALTLAFKTSRKAAAAGFDWENPEQVIDKIHEELTEISEARARGDENEIREEIGDLLLAVTNLARFLGVNPEHALRDANRKFVQRFNKLEESLQQAGEAWEALSPAELEERWQHIKQN